MSNTMFLMIPITITLIGLGGLWLFRRRPASMRSGMDAFSRELDALTPPDAAPRASVSHVMLLEPARSATTTADADSAEES